VKFDRMLERLKNPAHLTKTHINIIPGFLSDAIKQIKEQRKATSIL
jgi:hypothetical protein